MEWLFKRLQNAFGHFHTFIRLHQYTRRPDDKDFRQLVILQFIGVLLQTSSPFFWGKMITGINELNFTAAAIWLGASGVLKLILENLNYYRRVVRDRCQSKLRLYIGETFYTKFFGKSVGEHLREGTHLSAEYMRKGEQSALNMEDTMLMDGYSAFGEFFCVIVFLCILVPYAGLAMIGISLVNFIWNLYINNRVMIDFSPIERQWRKLGGFAEERIEKVIHIKNNAQEINTVREYQEKFQELYCQDHKFWRWYFKIIRIHDLINFTLWLGVIFFSLWQMKSGAMSVGVFLTLLIWSQSVMDKVWRITEIEAKLARHTTIVKQALDELEKPPAILEIPKPVPIAGVSQIEFRHVCFNYDGDFHTIRDFNLMARRGDRIAIVGPSGAGKSTLMSLLLRHYDPTSGEILIDGIPLSDLSLTGWKRLVGFIPQQIDLLDGTIFDNIVFGIPEGVKDSQKIDSVAESCGIWDFGDRLSKGLQTPIGEDGIQLSGGQRQRIAWATAVAKDPAVIIIDEGTSNLDALTERQLVANLDKFCQGRISFIIAHRLATLKSCNCFIVLRPIKDCQNGEPQLEALAKTFDECEQLSPTFRAMLKQQSLA